MFTNELLIVLLLLQLKHFIYDFYWQPPFMYKNKGTYGHSGGIVHALAHMFGSLAILNVVGILWFDWSTSIVVWFPFLCLAEAVIHYHVDWAKMNINKLKGWGPFNSEEFWQLLGLDQLLHQLTYVGMLWWLNWMLSSPR